jgi:hypothetical protein
VNSKYVNIFKGGLMIITSSLGMSRMSYITKGLLIKFYKGHRDHYTLLIVYKRQNYSSVTILGTIDGIMPFIYLPIKTVNVKAMFSLWLI